MTDQNRASQHLDGFAGERAITIPVVQRIEIAHLLQVESHIVNRFHRTTSHVIRFVGGGTFTVVHDDQGGPGEIKAYNLVLNVGADGVITLYWTYEAQEGAASVADS